MSMCSACPSIYFESGTRHLRRVWGMVSQLSKADRMEMFHYLPLYIHLRFWAAGATMTIFIISTYYVPATSWALIFMLFTLEPDNSKKWELFLFLLIYFFCIQDNPRWFCMEILEPGCQSNPRAAICWPMTLGRRWLLCASVASSLKWV